jgi:DNA-binding CsgD family transcriptional regulator/tetratricopeptide (TPR) repeat protein
VTDAVQAGRRAFDRHEWDTTYASLVDVEPSLLSGEDFERLATAAYLTGHDQGSTSAWGNSYRAFLAEHQHDRAARCAFWLGFGLIQRGETAQGGGWMARAKRLVQEHGLDVERGYLLIPQGLMRLGAGDFEGAYDHFTEAERIGRQFNDADLGALGLLGCGQALFFQGRPREGAERFDEVMVGVTGGEFSPTVSGIVYCAVIDACQETFDVERAKEWTTALSRWCADQPALVPYRGQCLVHRSQILQFNGAWREAMEAVVHAEAHLSEPPHPAIGMAHYQLGELRRLRGDLSGAEAAYMRAERAGRMAQPGLALVRLAQGHHEAAAAAIDTALLETQNPAVLARLLPALLEIMVATHQTDRAQAAITRLAALAEERAVPFLRGVLDQAEGSVLLAEGDAKAALKPLRRALSQWLELEAPYEAARTRVLIARSCRSVGDQETVKLETDAARRTFAELGAALDLRAMSDLIDVVDPVDTSGSLSPRELQVLHRVASGMTNQDIADELFISIKTVERHLSNIFAKLDAPNRAAATAAAHTRGLLT